VPSCGPGSTGVRRSSRSGRYERPVSRRMRIGRGSPRASCAALVASRLRIGRVRAAQIERARGRIRAGRRCVPGPRAADHHEAPRPTVEKTGVENTLTGWALCSLRRTRAGPSPPMYEHARPKVVRRAADLQDRLLESLIEPVARRRTGLVFRAAVDGGSAARVGVRGGRCTRPPDFADLDGPRAGAPTRPGRS